MSTTSGSTYKGGQESQPAKLKEQGIEYGLIGVLQDLKYEYRRDINDRVSLEKNFREKFEALNNVALTDAEFARLLDEIVTPDVFAASKMLRSYYSFTEHDSTLPHYMLVNNKHWCEEHFILIDPLLRNAYNSQHPREVVLLLDVATRGAEKTAEGSVVFSLGHGTLKRHRHTNRRCKRLVTRDRRRANIDMYNDGSNRDAASRLIITPRKLGQPLRMMMQVHKDIEHFIHSIPTSSIRSFVAKFSFLYETHQEPRH